MRKILLLAFALTLFTPKHAKAQSPCPWINNASAAGVLGSSVKAVVQELPAKGVVCSFNGTTHSGASTLVVEIRGVADHDMSFKGAESACTSPATPVKGLGNEAFECPVNQKGFQGMKIIGRVRDTLFVVTLTTPMQRKPDAASSSLEDKLTIATGQIVGNLF